MYLKCVKLRETAVKCFGVFISGIFEVPTRDFVMTEPQIFRLGGDVEIELDASAIEPTTDLEIREASEELQRQWTLLKPEVDSPTPHWTSRADVRRWASDNCSVRKEPQAVPNLNEPEVLTLAIQLKRGLSQWIDAATPVPELQFDDHATTVIRLDMIGLEPLFLSSLEQFEMLKQVYHNSPVSPATLCQTIWPPGTSVDAVYRAKDRLRPKLESLEIVIERFGYNGGYYLAAAK